MRSLSLEPPTPCFLFLERTLMIRINREDFLQSLELVQPGLSPREIVEQSSCFAFSKGKVMTFNDEIACRHKVSAKFTGAVHAIPLLAILRKLSEDELQLELADSELILHGKRRQTGIRMEKELLLRISDVEMPEENAWKQIPEDFLDAVGIVHQVASRDESTFTMTCIHITPKWIEASDNDQITRYNIKTGIGPTLVRSSSIKHILALGVTEFCLTETWMHFRSSNGLCISCRRYEEEYHDLSPFLKMEGDVIVLPKGLAEAADKAEVFSAENTDTNQVKVTLKPGKLRIKGTGVTGWYSESKSIKYDGVPMTFMISPKLLSEITKRHNKCRISKKHLMVDGGKFVYCTCLEMPKEEEES